MVWSFDGEAKRAGKDSDYVETWYFKDFGEEAFSNNIPSDIISWIISFQNYLRSNWTRPYIATGASAIDII